MNTENLKLNNCKWLLVQPLSAIILSVMKMKENILIEKSIDFGARIVKLHRYLVKEKHETVLSKQILRSGTSIGANINEAQYGSSKADFIAKL